MDEESKRKLDALFQDDVQRAQKAEKQRDEEADAQAAFLESFIEARRSIIIPAFKDFADYLGQNGWTGTVLEQDETAGYGTGNNRVPDQSAAAKVEFYRGTTRPRSAGRGDTLPYFSAQCDKAKRTVTFFDSTIGPNHGGSSSSSGTAQLDQLTSKMIEERLVAYFRRLMSDSRPYSQR